MTLHVKELAEIGGRGELVKMAKRYNICPLAFGGCYGARDVEIFERACSKNFKSCSNLQNNNPITQTEYNSKNYVIEFIESGKSMALSGEQI